MAITGTRQHNAVDSQLDDPRLADYRAAAVSQCIKFAEECLAAFPGGIMLNEIYLPVDDRILNVDGKQWTGTTAGYLDRAIISADEREAVLLDWKFGNNAVEAAENNLQGISYMLGLLKKYPKLQKVTVIFIMPHQDWSTTHTFHASEKDKLMLRVRVVVARAQEARRNPDDFSTANANVSSCLFCAHIGVCPKVAEIALSLGKKFRPLEIPEHVTPSNIKDPKDVGLGIRLAAVVATWAEAFRRQATQKTIRNPDFIPDGYTLVESQKRSVVRARTLGALAKEYLPEEQHHLVDELFDVPLGKLEELVSTFAPRGSKEDTVRQFGDRAITAGALEMGQPFSFLRQSRVQEKGNTATS